MWTAYTSPGRTLRRLGCFAWAMLAAGTALVVSIDVHSAPVVLEETAKITLPDRSFYGPMSVAADGDWIIATGYKNIYDPTLPGDIAEYAAWLYRRQADGTWRLMRRLVAAVGPDDPYGPQAIVDMHQGVAAIVTMTAGTYVFERSGEVWAQAPNTIDSNGFDVGIDAGTIVVTVGYCEWRTNAYRKATDGVWRLVRTTPHDPDHVLECDNEYDLDAADVSGSSIIVTSLGETGSSVRIFEGPFGTTPTLTRLFGPQNARTWQPIALDLPTALAASHGTHFAYVKDASGWRIAGSVQTADELAVGVGAVDMRAGIAARGAGGDLRGKDSGSIDVFQRNTDGTLRHIAKLVASDGAPEHRIGSRPPHVSGRRVLASDTVDRSFYVFDLPTTLTQPRTLQDTFESGNFSRWTTLAGSTFSVAAIAGSNVLRQTSVTGDAGAFLDGTDWHNQAIEAEIRPRSLASGSGSRWFGLVTRYTPGNYYYVTLRNSNEVQIRKLTNGAISVLASAALPLTLNRNYRVRLEAIGTRIRVFVDDRLLVEASDAAHRHGQAGIFMYKMAVDYDNVVVSANPQTILVRYSGHDGPDADSSWSWEALGDWRFDREPNGNGVLALSSLTGDGRAIGGIATDDQVVRTRVKRTAAAGSSNWFGLATRYRDARNYYYVTVRNTNVISLRKLVNGGIVELDTAPLTVMPDTWYDLRFAAIGDQLRVYVNDALLLEATDASYASGRYGPVLYKNAALYDDFTAAQP